MTRRGYVSPARAARMLDVHRNTVYGWAVNAARGEPSRLSNVERHPITGRLSIPIAEVERIKKDAGE